ncbi:DUF5403 family protein [Kribbella sp. NBC_01505]|uniref:DUF5403 family protein n=1 Tax=Kribbella sp. NBC_01505 TaxID=2903580 RepID=UPI003868A03D
MADVYRFVAGIPIQEYVALTDEVQEPLASLTSEIAERAQSLLVEHRHDGDAQIETAHGDIDHFVILSDERGQAAALSIEFGREAGETKDGRKVTHMEGLHVLGRAAKLKWKKR